MRFLSGLVIGAGLLIGASYIHDSSIDPSRDPTAKTLVNWDVAGGVFRDVGRWVAEQLNGLAQMIHRQD